MLFYTYIVIRLLRSSGGYWVDSNTITRDDFDYSNLINPIVDITPFKKYISPTIDIILFIYLNQVIYHLCYY